MENVRELHTASHVIDRMKEAVDAKNDSDLAKLIGVAKTTISSWRKRNSVPYRECVDISFRYAQRLDWLLTGRGKAYELEGFRNGPIDYEVMTIVVEAVEHSWELDDLAQQLTLRNKAALICNFYRDYGRIVTEAIKTGKFSREEAITLLRNSLGKMIDKSYTDQTEGPQ
jgi:DNA-binding XRE family transcriptional regulator